MQTDALQFPHKATPGSSAVLATLCARKLASVIVACGQYSPAPQSAERTLFFEESRGRLRPLLDVWLAPEAHGEILQALRGKARVATGACSALYTGKPSIVWADCGDELRLWRHGRLAARFSPRETAVRRWLIGPWKTYSNARFIAAHGFLSPSWLHRGVRLHGANRATVPIASMLDPIVFLDPAYRERDLAFDASWVRSLAGAISDVTSIPLKLDFPLA